MPWTRPHICTSGRYWGSTTPACLSPHFKQYRHAVAFLQIFCFSDARFDWHKIAAIFGEQRCFPLGVPDPDMHRNHPPTVGYDSGNGFQVPALLLRNCHEEPGSGSLPEPDLTLELDVHWHSISNPQYSRRIGSGARGRAYFLPHPLFDWQLR